MEPFHSDQRCILALRHFAHPLPPFQFKLCGFLHLHFEQFLLAGGHVVQDLALEQPLIRHLIPDGHDSSATRLLSLLLHAAVLLFHVGAGYHSIHVARYNSLTRTRLRRVIIIHQLYL